MHFLQNKLQYSLHNRKGRNWINDCFLTYNHKDLFDTNDNDIGMKHIHNMYYSGVVP